MKTIMLNLTGYIETDILYTGIRTIVCRGVRTSDRQSVIIKVLRNFNPNFNELVQFRNQYIIARNLEHPAIVRPLALERYGNSYALLMPDTGEVALKDYWQQSNLSLGEFLEIAIQLSDALHYLIQERIIHKDIKPSNILIHPKTGKVKLIDFSISSLLPKEQQQLTNPNVLEGTLAYISPEQTGRMNRGIDYRTDFYSLGATFFELLTGQLPFETSDPMELIHCHIAKMPGALGKRQEARGKRGVVEVIPAVLSDIVLKLMAKNAEDRYQSALGLKYDLERCLEQLESTGEIATFEIGERDRSDRFLIPEKLYGRETEVQTLLDAFERVAGGNTEMMLVAGFSGIGKTAVINEVHKPIVEKRGYFIKGKFDQFNRNIPFSAFVQAFRDLMGQLLGESDKELASWKGKILDALGDNAGAIVDVVPELERIIGKQPPAPELSGSAAQNRFNLLFQKFIALFSASEHPLAIFLDDLQWADSGSLNLIKILMGNARAGYLLLLGAYRDNEVFPAHPLMLQLDELQKNKAVISTIVLEPLAFHHINRLVADTLSCREEIASALSQLVCGKTKGNPFFTTQFLKGLHQEKLLVFNLALGYWECDLSKVREAALASDVVEFMAGRLLKLPAATQEVLKLAACIGDRFDLETLATVCQESEEQVAADIWTSLQEGLILPMNEAYKFFSDRVQETQAQTVTVSYRFLHDRVQQAAYSLIPQERKREAHLQIGQLLLEKIPESQKAEKLFDIVNQINIGVELITDEAERDRLASLNLQAGTKAKLATAYTAALKYFDMGLGLLPKDCWQQCYSLALTLHENAAEAAYLAGNVERMEELVKIVTFHAKNCLDRVKTLQVKMQFCAGQNQFLETIKIARNLLQELGIILPESPTMEDVRQELENIEDFVAQFSLDEIAELPALEEPHKLAAASTLMLVSAVTIMAAPNLNFIVISTQVKLSLKYGNSPYSPYGYSCYRIWLGFLKRDIQQMYQFGQLGLKLLRKSDFKIVNSKVYQLLGAYITHGQSHVKETLEFLTLAYTSGLESGDFEFAGYSIFTKCQNLYFLGRELTEFEKEITIFYQALSSIQQNAAFSWIQVFHQAAIELLGGDKSSHLLGEYSADEFVGFHSQANDIFGLHYFYFNRAILLYFFEDSIQALENSNLAEKYLDGPRGFLTEIVFYFYDSLIRLSCIDELDNLANSELLIKVSENQNCMKIWADSAPMNFQHKYDLVRAEERRISGYKLEAMEMYDRAIAGAKENEYVQEEGLANELAAKFYLEWGKETIAAAYMQKAYYCYACWGAKAKTEQLEAKYPQLLTPILQQQRVEFNPIDSLETVAQTLTSVIQEGTQTGTNISEALDFASILQAAQTLSSTIELDELLANIARIILIDAGAQKTVLLVPFEEQWQVRAIAQLTTDASIETSTKSEPLTANSPVPVRLVQYVKNLQKAVLINEAKTEITGILQGYILKYQPQSVFCLPLLDRGNVPRPGKFSGSDVAEAERQNNVPRPGKFSGSDVAEAERQNLVAILYLEHRTTKGVFTRNRQTIIKFLCAQAAIALENAQLYNQAQQALKELKQAQLQLVQSEKMSALGNLVAGVAHEINNPTGFLQGNIQPARDYVEDLLGLINLYQAEYPQPNEVIEEAIEAIDLEFIRKDLPKLLESMNVGIDRIRNISKSLRTFSRKDREHKTEFRLHEGIDSTLLILKHRTKANGERPAIEIVKDYADIPGVQCFPGQLNQVFMNILANAIDAFDEANEGKTYTEIEANPNRITIRTAMVNNWVEIKIIDNGCGMKPETKERIFEQGFTTKGVGKGTGLGMAIARNIITEKHGGTITCDSTLGVGTTFAIALPIA